jgi:hypothetical protein
MEGVFPEIVLTEEQEEEASRIEDILNAKGRMATKYMARLLASKSIRELYGEAEFQIRDAVHRLGAEALDAALAERKKKGYEGSSRVCPECGEDARFEGYRDCRARTLLDEVIYERAYYYCRHCRRGHFPTDGQFRIVDRQSPGVSEVIALLGVLERFAEGARQVLPACAGSTCRPQWCGKRPSAWGRTWRIGGPRGRGSVPKPLGTGITIPWEKP